MKKDNPLMEFIEEEVPFRIEKILEEECTDEEKEYLIDVLKEDVDQMFDYDKLDNFLLKKLNEYRK